MQQPAGVQSGHAHFILLQCRLALAALFRLGLARRALAERDRWILFVPVALAVGILIYFQLAEEPSWLACALLAGCGLAMIVAIGRYGVRWHDRDLHKAALVGVGLVAIGFGIAGLRAYHVEAPVIERQGSFAFNGRIIAMEPRKNGYRLLLSELSLDDVETADTPERIRVTTRSREPELQVGDRIVARGMLQRPQGPLLPGGFDYSRRAYFEQLGGLGFTFGDVEIIDQAEGGSFADTIAALRHRIASSAIASLASPEGAVAGALLTGLRSDIPQKVWIDMQSSGLAHLLAISGLHIGLIAGTIFLMARYALALIEPLAIRFPVKKLAALIALFGAFGYLLLAGATVPTQRAFMMAGIALVAVMLDRNPISMRLVAIAAMGVLLHRPESVLGASFQMSFAAVVGLIAFYERRPAFLKMRTRDDELSLPRHFLLYLLGIMATTLIATIATTGFAAVHFQRVATYGVIANLLAVPITAFWIMPAGLFSLLLMPLGLESYGFAIMGQGIAFVLWIAAAVTSLPGASLSTPPMPSPVLPLIAFGGLWLCLWRGPWRRWGLAPAVLGIIIGLFAKSPDILIAEGGLGVAARDQDGVMHLEARRRDKYRDEIWQRIMTADEITPMPEAGDLGEGFGRCDDLGCQVRFDQQTVAIARAPAAVAEDCRRADLVIVLTGADDCANGTLAIGPGTLWWSDGISIDLSGDAPEIRRVRPERGERLWTKN
ncbi:MAG: ComEC/Rec2 family competence protein [Pseudomonadota bacterium]